MAIGLNGPFYFIISDQEEREAQWGRKKTPELCPSNLSHRWILMYISSADAGMAMLLPMA